MSDISEEHNGFVSVSVSKPDKEPAERDSKLVSCLAYPSTLKMDAICSPKRLSLRTKRRHNFKDHTLHNYLRENPKTDFSLFILIYEVAFWDLFCNKSFIFGGGLVYVCMCLGRIVTDLQGLPKA
jgi:hypothetical protein